MFASGVTKYYDSGVMKENLSWKNDLTDALAENGETWKDVEANTLSAKELKRTFDHGYGSVKGPPFTMWTKKYVYFPVCYDGAEWVGSVARHPDGKPTGHFGGG